MIFVTNRFPTQSIKTRLGRNFTFDLKNNAPSNSVFFCERTGPETHTEIGSIAFLDRLKNSKCRQILVYSHGFNMLPEAVFKSARRLQKLCDGRKKDEILVIPLIWPCDADLGVVGDYWDDQKAADQSAYSFGRVLQKFLAWRASPEFNPEDDPCLKRINMLAHSMGNRVLRETLAEWNANDLPDGVPLIFRNTFMVAADVVNETLHKGERGEYISHASRNVVVYHASDDLALRASKAANLKNRIASRRLGHTGPEDMEKTNRNVYRVDCDDVNTLYDNPTGHSYFLGGKSAGDDGAVFHHIFDCLLSGRVFPQDEDRRATILVD
ncbi:MAG: alpha/beta hydrolase [Pseudomonadota bacterium]